MNFMMNNVFCKSRHRDAANVDASHVSCKRRFDRTLHFGHNHQTVVAILGALLAFACATTDSRLLVAPDGSKALYVECSSGPVDCLEVISERCPSGYEILVQGSRGEILAGDKWTEMATNAVANKSGLKGGGVQATPTTIREMLARCGRSKTGSSDLKTLLDTSDQTVTSKVNRASGSVPSEDSESPTSHGGARAHVCGSGDASDLREKWERILSVRNGGVSQPATSAAFACRLVRQFFVQGCPDWDPKLPAVAREVCRIADREAGRDSSDDGSKPDGPPRQDDTP